MAIRPTRGKELSYDVENWMSFVVFGRISEDG